MKKLNNKQIDWKKCEQYIAKVILQINESLERKEYESLKQVTKNISPDLPKIRLYLSREIKKRDEIEKIAGLVGMLADQFNLNAELDSNRIVHISGNDVQDPLYSGIRSYSFEPKDYAPFLKQQTA